MVTKVESKTENNVKFYCPNPLVIIEQLCSYTNIVNNLKNNLCNLLYYENEDNEHYSGLVEIILNYMFEDTIDLQNEIDSLREEFSKMPISEWEKFHIKWNTFIDSIDDLKLNIISS